jgi:hypothetical protein
MFWLLTHRSETSLELHLFFHVLYSCFEIGTLAPILLYKVNILSLVCHSWGKPPPLSEALSIVISSFWHIRCPIFQFMAHLIPTGDMFNPTVDPITSLIHQNAGLSVGPWHLWPRCQWLMSLSFIYPFLVLIKVYSCFNFVL